MKKSLVAVAVLGAFSAMVLAESNVTLYGLIDEAVLVQKANKGPTRVNIASGFTAGTRWGIRGVEDLGGGNKVGFILEQGFNIDTGNAGDSSKAFQRESALYVDGGWGRLTAGRLGTLGFAQSTAILQGAIFGTTYGPSGWNANGQNLNFSRVDNAIAYKSPSFGGFSLHAMYSNGPSTDDSGVKWSDNNHYYGIGALYTGGDIKASIIYEAEDFKDTKGFPSQAKYHLTLGGSWKLGAFTPNAIYQYQWGSYKQHAAQLGLATDVAGGQLLGAVKYVTRSGDDNLTSYGDRSARNWNIGLAYLYPLSKRTKVYGYGGWSDSGGAWGSDGFQRSSTGTGSNGYQYNGWAIGAGMVHNF